MAVVADLLAYCRKEPEVQAMIRGELAAAPKQGRPSEEDKGNNITFTAGDRGTAATYTLRRLKRDALQSDRVIAEKAKMSQPAVGDIRKRGVAAGEVKEVITVIGKDGVAQPAKKKRTSNWQLTGK